MSMKTRLGKLEEKAIKERRQRLAPDLAAADRAYRQLTDDELNLLANTNDEKLADPDTPELVQLVQHMTELGIFEIEKCFDELGITLEDYFDWHNMSATEREEIRQVLRASGHEV